jgi:hypothetical protein
LYNIGNLPGGFDYGVLSRYLYEDKSYPLQRDKQGQNQKPDYDFTNRGLLFPQNDPSEYVQILDQMSHTKLLGAGLKLHVHFIQTTSDLPIFKCDYKFWNNGDEVPGSDTTISTADGEGPVHVFTSNPILQIIRFPEIPAPQNEGVSAHFEFNLYRDDNLISGDVLGKYIDYHYLKVAQGSPEEYFL